MLYDFKMKFKYILNIFLNVNVSKEIGFEIKLVKITFFDIFDHAWTLKLPWLK